MHAIPLEKRGYDLLHKGSIAFSEMQMNGIRIDVDYAKQTYKDVSKQLKEQKQKVYDYKEIKEWKKIYKDKFNLDSGDQLKDVLFNKFGYEAVHFTEKGNESTSKEALIALGLPFTDDLIHYRQLSKTKNTYLKNILKETQDGYLHPFMNLNSARTFRSSSNRPNIQNMPIRDPEIGAIVRKCFIPRDDHYLIEEDYGGIEVKGSAWYHKDPTMLEYLRNPLTADMHLDFTRLLFKMPEDAYEFHKEHKGDKTLRKGTKNGFTFPQFYGDYYGNNAVSLWTWLQLTGKKIKPGQGLEISAGMTIGDWLRKHGITTYKQFEKHVQKVEQDMWDNRFPVYKQWRENQYQWYLRHGYLTSLSGFTFQTIMSKNDTANYPIQGVCFHCLLWGIIRLLKLIKKKKMRTKLIFQVHDSIMADTPKEERDDFLELSKQVMCHDLKRYWDFIITPLELEADCSELNGNWHKMETIMHYIH